MGVCLRQVLQHFIDSIGGNYVNLSTGMYSYSTLLAHHIDSTRLESNKLSFKHLNLPCYVHTNTCFLLFFSDHMCNPSGSMISSNKLAPGLGNGRTVIAAILMFVMVVYSWYVTKYMLFRRTANQKHFTTYLASRHYLQRFGYIIMIFTVYCKKNIFCSLQ